MSGRLRCDDCNMVFATPALLDKHKYKFCVGSAGDPDTLMLRKGFRSIETTEYVRTDSPVREEYPRYNPNQDAQVRHLAESHGRQMEYLSNRNKDLEKQRDDIRRRLENLGTRVVPVVIQHDAPAPQPLPPPPPKSDLPSEFLLRELKEQEQRNQKALEELKRELFYLRDRRDAPPPPPPQPLPPPPPPQIIEIERTMPSPRKNYIYPVYYGGSLLAEVTAIRQAYLQNGGSDPEVLSSMAHMMEEAKQLEMDSHNKETKGRDRPHPQPLVVNTQITAMEMENERLQRELLLVQEQKILNKQKNRTGREDDLERELRKLQQEYLLRMTELQHEMDLMRQMAMMDRMRPLPQAPPPPPPPPEPKPPVRQYVEVDPLAPYDPNSGFVIFYDFGMNLESGVTSARLIVGLHSSSEVMGEPTILPTVYTEPTVTQNNYYYNFTNAVIGAKQSVPRCPANQDLGIVVELQTAGGPGSDHDNKRLITRAWTKLPLFDKNNRLISGRFRRKFRNVPIKPFLQFQDITNIPLYGEVELYYRIVNMRDANTHSLVTVSASNHDAYKALPEPGSAPLASYREAPAPTAAEADDNRYLYWVPSR